MKRSQFAFCAFASLLGLAALLFTACGRSKTSVPVPDYLRDQIQRNSPQGSPLTPYRTSGPAAYLVSSMISHDNAIFLGSFDGVYRSNDGLNWKNVNNGLDQNSKLVISLASVPGTLYAATSAGLYKSRNDGESWQPVDSVLGREAVNSLVQIGNALFVLAPSGIYRSEIASPKQDLWKSISFGLEGVPLYSLMAAGDYLYVTSDNRAFISGNRGDSWEPMQTEGLSGPPASIAQSGPTIIAAGSAGEIMIYDLVKNAWGRADVLLNGQCGSAMKIYSVGSQFWSGGMNGLCSSENSGKTWDIHALAPKYVTALFSKGSRLFAGSFDGLFVSSDGGTSWMKAVGLKQTRLPCERVVAADGKLFTSAFGSVYRSVDKGKSWYIFITGLQLPFLRGDMTVVNGKLMLLTGSGIYTNSGHDAYWTFVSGLTSPPAMPHLVSTHDRLLATFGSSGAGLWRSDDNGKQWFPSEVGSNVIGALFATEKSAFVGTARGVFRSNDHGDTWQPAREGIEDQPVTSLAGSDDAVIAGTEGGGLFKLKSPDRSQAWQRLPAKNLAGVRAVTAIWVDSNYPNVMIVGTSHGLFWSNDEGEEFHPFQSQGPQSDFRVVYGINSADGQLFMSTEAGVFYLDDQIPRVPIFLKIKEAVKGHLDWVRDAIVVLCVAFFLSTRLILLLLQLELWGIKEIAQLLYLTAWGRWRLFRRYRIAIANDQETRDRSMRYVDLPYQWSGIASGQATQKLSERIGTLPRCPRLVVVAQGGRGKSTLCQLLAFRAAQGTLRFEGRRVEPVMVEALGYTGELLTAITASLKSRHAYVNSAIVESQLIAGRLMIILDGFSEIRKDHRDAADANDIPKFIKEHANTSFVFASRSPLPAAVRESLGPVTAEIELEDLDEQTVRPFLARYLANGERQVDVVIEEIKKNFFGLPMIPLLLMLIAKVFDKKGNVPQGRASLFEEYLNWILRPEATGIEERAGLDVALRHLVTETFLKTGERGFTIEQAVTVFGGVKDRLKGFDIDLSEIKLVSLFVRAGLYKRNGDNLKFFHDSFESYCAATVLEKEFHGKKYDRFPTIKANKAFAETWGFLNEILTKTDETSKLEEALADATNSATVSLDSSA